MKVLVIDVGGTNVKVSMGVPGDTVKIPSGAEMTAAPSPHSQAQDALSVAAPAGGYGGEQELS